MMGKITCSVIIPTYNGKHKIQNALNSLKEQDRQPDEIIVVIDGSTDGTVELLKSDLYNSFVKVIHQKNGGRAQARNIGAKAATGSLLLFLDDDMIASKCWVAAHESHHKNYPASLMTGREEESEEFQKNEFGLFMIWLHRNWTKYEFKDGDNNGESLELVNPYITASNFSVPKDLFFELNGFDDRLRDAEDFDLAIRAHAANKKIYYNFSALAFNNDTVLASCTNLILRHREYQKANDLLRTLNPFIEQNRPHYIPSFPKNLIFKFVCHHWWITSIENEYWTWLPDNIRFKLYDIIITANGTFYPNIVKLKKKL